MPNKQIGYRFPENIVKDFVEKCRKEDKSPRAVLERFMKDYAEKVVLDKKSEC